MKASSAKFWKIQLYFIFSILSDLSRSTNAVKTLRSTTFYFKTLLFYLSFSTKICSGLPQWYLKDILRLSANEKRNGCWENSVDQLNGKNGEVKTKRKRGKRYSEENKRENGKRENERETIINKDSLCSYVTPLAKH